MQVSKYLTWYHSFDENIQFFIWTGRYLFYATTCKWKDNRTSRKQVKTYFIKRLCFRNSICKSGCIEFVQLSTKIIRETWLTIISYINGVTSKERNKIILPMMFLKNNMPEWNVFYSYTLPHYQVKINVRGKDHLHICRFLHFHTSTLSS